MNYWVDRENPNSIYNWAEGIKLMCRPGWQIGLLGSAYFSGWCLTLLWMPQMSEKIGRKKFFQQAQLLTFLLYAVMVLTSSFTCMVVCFFFQGFLNSARTGVGWPYLLEIVPSKDRAAHAAALGVQGAVRGILGALFFTFCSKNGYVFMATGCVYQLIAILLV